MKAIDSIRVWIKDKRELYKEEEKSLQELSISEAEQLGYKVPDQYRIKKVETNEGVIRFFAQIKTGKMGWFSTLDDYATYEEVRGRITLHAREVYNAWKNECKEEVTIEVEIDLNTLDK